VVFTHVNADAVHRHPLNLTDEQITACARSGGVIGVSASPALVSSGPATSRDVLRQLDHIVRLVGLDHVALGLDFDSRPERRYPTDPIPDPPLKYPTGLARFGDLPAFAELMASRGIGPTERAKVLGGNLERVLRKVWES
jgi:membrane dipeptidase